VIGACFPDKIRFGLSGSDLCTLDYSSAGIDDPTPYACQMNGILRRGKQTPGDEDTDQTTSQHCSFS
jgi:hypothetical protein